MRTEISIVVPFYNSAACIIRCAESLSEQTFRNFEVLFVDDCSTDNGAAELDAYIKSRNFTDISMRIIRQDHNQGPGSARNRGMDEASGRWCGFVDADDWVEKDFIANLFVRDIRSGDVVVGGFSYDKTGVAPSPRLCNSASSRIEDIHADVFGNAVNYSVACARIYDMSLIRRNGIRFPTEISLHEDTVFFLTYLSSAERLVFTGKCDYHYVLGDAPSLSSRSLTPDEYVRISMALFDVWHRFLPRLTKVSLEELRPCIKRYGLSQLLQAVRAQYFTWPRDRNVRMELIKYVRTKRPLFNKYYDARSAFVRLYLIGIFNMPMSIFDGVMVFLGFVCSFMKGKERIAR